MSIEIAEIAGRRAVGGAAVRFAPHRLTLEECAPALAGRSLDGESKTKTVWHPTGI